MEYTRSRDEFTACNRAAWNEAAPVHAASELDRLLHEVRKPGFTCLDATATRALQEAGVAGSRVAQLACNNGREVLSMLALGAASGVGFDISGGFIAQAGELAQCAGHETDCEFLVSDLYEIPPATTVLLTLCTAVSGCWAGCLTWRVFLALRRDF